MKQQLLSILKSDLAKSSSIIVIAILSSNLIVFLANLYIANELGAANFGVFKTILYFFSFFPLIIDLGVNVTLTKYIAEFRNKEKGKIGYLVKWFLKIKVLSYISLAFLFLIFREQVIALFLKDVSLSYLIIPGILLAVFTIFSTFEAIVLGFQNFRLFAISQFLGLAVSSLLGILMLPFGIFYVILGWSVGPLIGNIFNIKFFFNKNLYKKAKEFDIKHIFYKFSVPMLLITIITGLSGLIVPLLSLFFPAITIGYFSFAFIFYSAVSLIPNSLSSVLFPKVSELNGLKKHGDARSILKRIFVLYSLFVLAMIVFILLFSEQFITIVSKVFLPSLFMFKILVVLGLVFGYNTIYTNYLKGLGKVKKFALLTLVQNFLLILISFMLVSV